jgi:hypothetical protein
METGVIPKLCQRKPFQPIFRAGMDKAPKEGFQAMVHSVHLPIRLRMIRGTHLQGHIGQLKKLLPEMADENSIPVRNND